MTSTPIRTTIPTPKPAPAASVWKRWPAISAPNCRHCERSEAISCRSAQHPDLLAFDQVEIDLGAEAGFARRVDETVAVDGDVFGEAVFLHRVRQQHLEEFGIADRHDHVEIGDIVQ